MGKLRARNFRGKNDWKLLTPNKVIKAIKFFEKATADNKHLTQLKKR